MRPIKTFLLVCGIFLLAFSSTAAGAGARELRAPAAQTPGTTYVIRPGDNLSNIAWRAYGNAGAWVCIWDANKWIVNPNYLLPGWTINLPASGACGGPSPPPPAGTTYVVQGGDNLSTIAFRYYGNAASWACIWAANPWIVNPNYLLPGWRITIPPSGSCGGPTPPAPRYHTVARSETLSGIACYYYTDCNYWRIYDANRNLIWYPGYIQAGWTLYIP